MVCFYNRRCQTLRKEPGLLDVNELEWVKRGLDDKEDKIVEVSSTIKDF